MKKSLLLIFQLTSVVTYAQSFVHRQLPASFDTRNVAIGDLDNNSFPDIFFSNVDNNASEVYLTFKDTLIQLTSGIGNITSKTRSVAIGDYNNDCYPDLFLVNGGGGAGGSSASNQLMKNNGNGNYSAVSSVISNSVLSSIIASWGDYDSDGDLDLYVSNNDGDNNELFKNNGLSFSKITNQSLVQDLGDGQGCVWIDYDEDGDQDLFVAFYGSQPNRFYQQTSPGIFTLVNSGPIYTNSGNSSGGSWGDYNNDGHIDLFISNQAGQNNFLFKNLGAGNFQKISGLNISSNQGYSSDAAWGDLNNDGYLDLVVVNGRMPMVNADDVNMVYMNNGNETFTRLMGGDPLINVKHSSTSVAMADLDRNGSLDVITSSRFEPNDIFFNQGNTYHFVSFELKGSISNSSAFGARVKVLADINGNGNASWQYRTVLNHSGSGQSSNEVHFGLKNAGIIDSLVINWPSGQSCRLANISVDAFYNLGEGNCSLDTLINASFKDSSSFRSVYLTDKSKGAISSYAWDFGDGNSSSQQNPSHTYAVPGIYTICLSTQDSYCKWDTSCTTVEICPDTSRLGFFSTLLNLQASFTDTSISAAHTISWDFGDGNSGTGKTVNHTYASSGAYTVCLNLQDSCRSKQICKVINICGNGLQANFQNSISGRTITLTDLSQNADSVYWSFGDGNKSSIPNPVHTYTNPGVYLVCLTAFDNCGSTTYCDTLRICDVLTQAAFSFNANQTLVNFSDSSTFASSWYWDFGDGNNSTQQNPAHLYAAYGNYKVCLSSSSDCNTDSICTTISLCPVKAQASYSYAKGGIPLAIQFNNTSTDAVSYLWNFGDGSTSTNKHPLKIFSAYQIYNVCLNATDSCGGVNTVCTAIDMNTVGLSDYPEMGKISLYPNPVKDRLSVKMENISTGSASFLLYDLSAKMLQKRSHLINDGDEVQLDLGALPGGVYMLKVVLGESSQHFRIVKD